MDSFQTFCRFEPGIPVLSVRNRCSGYREAWRKGGTFLALLRGSAILRVLWRCRMRGSWRFRGRAWFRGFRGHGHVDNRYIALANSEYPSATIAKKLEYAWSDNIKEREIDATHSRDTAGRDTDCYFASRHSIAASHSDFEKRVISLGGTVATGAYIGLKSIFKAASSAV